MRTLLTKAVLLAAALALSGAAQAGETIPTPGIARIDELDIPGAAAWAMKGALGDSGITVGLAAVCATEGPRRVEATAFFGGFPGDRRPVQLAVRIAEGTVERFGPVVSGGPESGFHSPRIVNPIQAARLARAAFRLGSLVSNGYRSFRNRAGEARNGAVLEACIGRRPQGDGPGRSRARSARRDGECRWPCKYVKAGGSQCLARAAGTEFLNCTRTVRGAAFIALPGPGHKRSASAFWQLVIRVDEASYCLSPLLQRPALRVN